MTNSKYAGLIIDGVWTIDDYEKNKSHMRYHISNMYNTNSVWVSDETLRLIIKHKTSVARQFRRSYGKAKKIVRQDA